MDKKIKICNCYFCPDAYGVDRGGPTYCLKADRDIKKIEREKYDENGEFQEYIIPDWCPLEDY
jgi:hypothetical protein